MDEPVSDEGTRIFFKPPRAANVGARGEIAQDNDPHSLARL
jgi:hypothetical protein